MKSTFLLVAAPVLAGMSKMTFRDVNGGEGLNDFRSGDRNGQLILDYFGSDFTPEPGETYVLSLEKYVEVAGTAENSDNGSATTNQPAAPAPLKVAFNALVTVGVDENGAPTLDIAAQPVAPIVVEENADTQDQGSIATGETTNQTNATDEGSANTDNSTTQSQQGVETGADTDTNTQGNTGAAAGSENNTAADNVDANPGDQTGTVDSQTQVS